MYPERLVTEFGLPSKIISNAAAVWSELIHPEDEMTFLRSNQEIADGRLEQHIVEYRARNTDGNWVKLRCRGKMMRDAEGEPEIFAGFISKVD